MIDRRMFLKSLAGLTAGILISPSTSSTDDKKGGEASDRLGALLPKRLLGLTAKR